MNLFGSVVDLSSPVTQGILFLGITYLLYKYFKPNKKCPPGPIGLPIVGYLPFFGNEPHKVFLELSKKYKENIISIRLGMDLAVILNEFKVAKEVLCHPNALDRHPGIFTHITERGFFSNNGQEWNEQRRFCMQSTKDLGLGTSRWEKMIEEEVNSFVRELCALKGSSVAVTDTISNVASSNIISLLIGRRLDKETEKSKIKLLVDFMDQSMSAGLSLPVTMIPMLREILVLLRIGLYYAQDRTVKMFSKFVNEEIRKHKTDDEHREPIDFIDFYLRKTQEMKTKDANHFFTDGNLEGNVNVLFLGGSDTIATSMDWLLRLMAAHQDVQNKVQDEIDEVLGHDGRITYSERMKLPYTMAVMMESQRFSSIVPLSPNRRANADIQVNGFTIPKGAHIIANLWALHYDPTYWVEPEKFKPERFLAEDQNELVKNPQSFGAFSFGRRNCPGEKIAYTELLLFFTTVMQRFKVLPPADKKVHFEFCGGLVSHLKPQPLCFVDRFEETISA